MIDTKVLSQPVRAEIMTLIDDQLNGQKINYKV